MIHAMQHILEEAQPVLLLGEGKFSFAVALAARRGSWNGICATALEDPPSNYHEVLLNQVQRVTEEWPAGHETDTLSVVREILQLKVADEKTVFHGGVDATDAGCLDAFLKTHPDRDACRKNIYFQCPWRSPGSTSELLMETLTAAASVQSAGDWLYFGLINDEQYTAYYQLDDILAFAHTVGYLYEGVDDQLVDAMVYYGYHCYHKVSEYELHEVLRCRHYTLCFRKMALSAVDSPTVSATADQDKECSVERGSTA